MAPGRQVKPITWISNERRGGTSSISKKKKSKSKNYVKKKKRKSRWVVLIPRAVFLSLVCCCRCLEIGFIWRHHQWLVDQQSCAQGGTVNHVRLPFRTTFVHAVNLEGFTFTGGGSGSSRCLPSPVFPHMVGTVDGQESMDEYDDTGQCTVLQ
jgi:hypothetical protein